MKLNEEDIVVEKFKYRLNRAKDMAMYEIFDILNQDDDTLKDVYHESENISLKIKLDGEENKKFFLNKYKTICDKNFKFLIKFKFLNLSNIIVVKICKLILKDFAPTPIEKFIDKFGIDKAIDGKCEEDFCSDICNIELYVGRLDAGIKSTSIHFNEEYKKEINEQCKINSEEALYLFISWFIENYKTLIINNLNKYIDECKQTEADHYKKYKEYYNDIFKVE